MVKIKIQNSRPRLTKEERRVLNYVKRQGKVYESGLLNSLKTTKKILSNLLKKGQLAKMFDKAKKPYYIWNATSEDYRKYYSAKKTRAYMKTRKTPNTGYRIVKDKIKKVRRLSVVGKKRKQSKIFSADEIVTRLTKKGQYRITNIKKLTSAGKKCKRRVQ